MTLETFFNPEDALILNILSILATIPQRFYFLLRFVPSVQEVIIPIAWYKYYSLTYKY